MAEAPRLSLSDLRALVADATELEKGVRILDGNGISLLSRHEVRLFAEARGSGAAPYRVSVAFEEGGGARARCTCMAARSRPVCKHAAALLVAWQRAPEAFAVSDAAPPEAAAPAGGAKKRAVKTGKTDPKELLRRGVEQAGTLVRELATSGVASLAPGRTDQIRALAGSLREGRLRRLSAKALALADLLDAGQRAALDATAYAGLLVDMLLAVRKLERHLDGEPLEDRHAEELVGRSWRKEDRTPADGLDLVEYAFLARETADGFVIRERRLLDLATGRHHAEKQILPAFLAKRAEPLRSRAGQRQPTARGSVFPGYTPHRLELAAACEAVPLDAAGVRAFSASALPSAGAALAAFAEHRRDPFAPDAFPVAVRVEALLARGGRLLAMDADGAALHLASDPALEERLAAVLRSARLLALAGDVNLEAALPVLTPLAAAVETAHGPALVTLGVDGALAAPVDATSPLEAARRAGASVAAIALAEVREELVHLLVTGLGGVVPRAADALSARLRDLGLAKPAGLLDAAARRPEPADRLDDLVKVYQVLEIALVRLLGTVEVERAALAASPTWESVLVQRPEQPLEPEEVDKLRAAGRIGRYEAAWHLDGYYQAMPAEKLAARVASAWADGNASPFVVRACASRGSAAIAAAERAFSLPTGRVARLTAVKVLAAVGGEDARGLLSKVREGSTDPLLRVEATTALAAQEAAGGAQERSGGLMGVFRKLTRLGGEDYAATLATLHARVDAAIQRLREAPLQEERLAAVHELEESGDRSALPALRAAAAGDAAGAVRLAALRALGALADTESVDALVRMLAARAHEEERAKVAAVALGRLGDRRGLAPLLDAFAEGWKPQTIGDALLAMGAAAVEPLVGTLEERPDLVVRKVSLEVLKRLPPGDVEHALLERLASSRARLASRREDAAWPKLASVYLKLAAVHPDVEAAVARALVVEAATPATKEEKAVRRAAEKVLAGAHPCNLQVRSHEEGTRRRSG